MVAESLYFASILRKLCPFCAFFFLEDTVSKYYWAIKA